MNNTTNQSSTATKVIAAVSIVILIIAAISGFISYNHSNGTASSNEPVATVTGFKLNTYVAISGYSANTTEAVLNEALNLCDTYENMFSRTLPESTLYKVNHHETEIIPAELAELIKYGIYYSEISNDAFDITIGSVSQLWDFTAENPSVPAADAISEALQYVDYRQIILTPLNDNEGNYSISIPENTVLDLGAIAKGYIADRIKDFLLEKGINSAVINLGGNVLCVGGKPNGADFNIGIKKPFTSNEYLDQLHINDLSSVSSGTYERYFYQDGTFYHHILNPETGYSYNNGLTSVTIISEESVTGDCLSTTCFALGLENGMKLIESTPGVEAIFVTSDNEKHYSSGIKEKYSTDFGHYITVK